jgi:hypothetical protein
MSAQVTVEPELEGNGVAEVKIQGSFSLDTAVIQGLHQSAAQAPFILF